MNQLTEKQAEAWDKAVAELNVYAGGTLPAHVNMWDVEWADEVRPGRGHYINARYVDGEFYAQILMDVYGYPSTNIAELVWIHASSNEECDCEHCKDARGKDA